MISLLELKDKKETEKLFTEAELSANEFSSCLTAVNGKELLGYCLFDLDDKEILIRYISPLSDIPLADGILRSTLHIAAERGVMNAFYDDTISEDFFKKTGFIKDTNEKRLDIDKLFKSCCDCNKQEG